MLMVSLKGRSVMLSAGLLAALSGLNTALADVPASLDRVPANAAVVVTVRDMEQFRSRFEDMAKSLKIPMDGDEKNPITVTKKLLALEGLNKHGSLALAVLPDKDGKADMDHADEHGVMVVPVTDFAAFVKALGAEDTKGVASIKVDDKPAFAKDLGGGYAVVSPHKELVEGFEGKAGNLEKHRSNIGKSGQQIADNSDLMVVMSVAAMKPQLEERVGEMKEQLKMAGAMAQQGAEQVQAMADIMTNLADSFVRDAQVGIVGLGLGDNGVSLDFGAQYKEGTPSAKVLSNKGNATKHLARVPNQPFLFAMAADLSGPAIKQVIKDMAAQGDKAAAKDSPMGGLGSFATMAKAIDKIDGTSTIMGASPAGLMGLFANTATFVSTSDPTGYLKIARDTMKEISGKDMNGVKMTVDYKPESVEVAGVKADTWTAQVNADQNDPNAQQINMVMGMLFGQGGMGGMTAGVEGGVVSTLSQNTPLFTKAIEAAKSGKGLADDEQIKAVQKQLPENRTFELYLGTKSILDAVNAAMGMFGGGTEFKVPAKVSPVGLAASTEAGGLNLRLFVPADVIKTIATISESMKGGGEDGDAAPAGEKPKSPRF
jgi:hypothetical protein